MKIHVKKRRKKRKKTCEETWKKHEKTGREIRKEVGKEAHKVEIKPQAAGSPVVFSKKREPGRDQIPRVFWKA